MNKKLQEQSKLKVVMKFLIIFILVLVVAEVAALLVLRSQIDRYSTHWKNLAQMPVSEGSLTYLALGDSAAQGIGATSPGKGYVGLLTKSIEAKYDRPVHVTNISKSGAKLADCIRDQLPEIKGMNPDFVTIEIGGNDMKDFESDRFRQEMEVILAALPQQTVVATMPYFGGGRFSTLEDNVLKANIIIHELTNKSGHRVAELHDQVKTNDHLNTYAADFFHPSNAGYKNWHNAFWEVLEKDTSVILP